MDNTTSQNGLRAEGDELQFLTFLLGGKLFGIDIKVLKEIIKYIKPGEINSPVKSVDGVIELRGMKVPVMDLRRLFSFDATVTEKNRIILFLLEGHVLGLIVDEVMDVEALDPEAEVTPIPSGAKPSVAKGAYMKYVEGIAGAGVKQDEEEEESAPEPGRAMAVMMLNTGSLLTQKDKASLFA